MIYRVQDVLPEIAPFVKGAGVDATCEPGRTKALAELNRATRQLMNEGDWTGAEAEVCLPVEGCCLTLDERFEAVRLAANRQGPPLTIYAQGFKYLEGGLGELDCCGPDCIVALQDIGDGFPLHRDPDPAKPLHITAFSDREEDCDATLEIRGVDANGREILTSIPIRHSWKADRPPAYTPASPDGWTTGRWRQVIELRKPKTEGYVYVHGYDPATGDLTWLTTLRPETTSPCHRRYRVPGGGSCSQIIAKVALRFHPVSRDSDVVLIQNPDALARMVQALSALDANDANRYSFFRNSAISQLRKQIARRDRPAKTGINVRMDRAALPLGRPYSGRGFGATRFVGRRGATTVVMVENTKVERLAGTPGRDGRNGRDGADAIPWSPVFAIVPDGSRRVMRIVDWVGGTGTKPATGKYLGETGHVSDIALATDIRGDGGSGSLGYFVASDDLAGHRWVNVNESGQLRYADSHLGFEAHGLIVASVSAGVEVEVFAGGKFGGFADLTPGAPLYLSTLGFASHTAPETGLSQQVAIAKVADELFIDIEEPTEL